MKKHLPFLCLFALLVCFRVLGGLGITPVNFSPLAAFLLLSFTLVDKKIAALSLAAWLITDPLVNFLQGGKFLCLDQLGILLGLVALLPLAKILQKNFTWQKGIAGCVAAAFLFYGLTNLVSFFSLPQYYAKSLEGFTQAMWTGPAGLAPTWIFLRNSIGGNVLFGAVFLLARVPLSLYAPTPATVKVA